MKVFPYFLGNPSNSETPMFILQDTENVETNMFHHFINLILKQPFPKHQIEDQPDVFICLSVEKNVLFFEEFLEAFLKQDYPRQKLHLQVHFAGQTTAAQDILERKIDPIKSQFE